MTTVTHQSKENVWKAKDRIMSKRVLAVGNGNQLAEVTPDGVLLVHKWDERTKSYIAHSGDWSGSDGVNAKRGIRINTELEFHRQWVADLAETDDYAATMDAASGRGGYG